MSLRSLWLYVRAVRYVPIRVRRRHSFFSITMLDRPAANLLAIAVVTLLISPTFSFGIHRYPQRLPRLANIVSMSSTDMPSKADLDAILEVAIDASKMAGEIIIGNSGPTEVTKTKANSKDLLTLIDPLCEKTIKETVVATFPSHDFLGEEDVPPGKEASAAALDALLEKSNDWLWIVDPSEFHVWMRIFLSYIYMMHIITPYPHHMIYFLHINLHMPSYQSTELPTLWAGCLSVCHLWR